jgi:hypothetical protein
MLIELQKFINKYKDLVDNIEEYGLVLIVFKVRRNRINYFSIPRVIDIYNKKYQK